MQKKTEEELGGVCPGHSRRVGKEDRKEWRGVVEEAEKRRNLRRRNRMTVKRVGRAQQP